MQFGVYLVRLDPAEGTEIRKTRPCVVISPDDMLNKYQRAIIAPLTSKFFASPYRVAVRFDEIDGFAALDQIRAVSRQRLLRQLGKLKSGEGQVILGTARKMFE